MFTDDFKLTTDFVDTLPFDLDKLGKYFSIQLRVRTREQSKINEVVVVEDSNIVNVFRKCTLDDFKRKNLDISQEHV